MKINVKNIVNGVLLFMGILLYHNVYLQQIDNFPLVELNSENDATTNFGDADSEINEDDQVIYSLDFSTIYQKIESRRHLHVVRKGTQPLLSVWQPPKI